MMQEKEIDWIEPINLAQKIANNYQQNWTFLYSGLNQDIENSKSYIALFPKEELVLDKLFDAKNKINNSDDKWFGYLSYEVGREFEEIKETEKSYINLPKIWLINFSLILEFNHDKKSIKVNFEQENQLNWLINLEENYINYNFEVKQINSNFSDENYLKAIENIKEMIAKGDFYQVNLTRKFFGKFRQNLNHQQNFQIFEELANISPANYSSFLKLNENYIISSSPELFLSTKNNEIISRPIKGTAPRDLNNEKDLQNKLSLKNSAKEIAENLMIVDLVRNDLSRVCDIGSVCTKKLFEISTYKTIHHMSSEIYGKINHNSDIINCLKATFPPGSMTGAPKIKSMEIIANLEQTNRGIYSGTIGFISKNESNLSVVIRTLITQENNFEFQVGGAITFDSNSRLELQEIFNKAKGIKQVLKIS